MKQRHMQLSIPCRPWAFPLMEWTLPLQLLLLLLLLLLLFRVWKYCTRNGTLQRVFGKPVCWYIGLTELFVNSTYNKSDLHHLWPKRICQISEPLKYEARELSWAAEVGSVWSCLSFNSCVILNESVSLYLICFSWSWFLLLAREVGIAY